MKVTSHEDKIFRENVRTNIVHPMELNVIILFFKYHKREHLLFGGIIFVNLRIKGT